MQKKDGLWRIARGSCLPLKISPSVGAEELLAKALEKIVSFNQNVFVTHDMVTLVYPDRTENIFSVQSATKRGAPIKFYQNQAELIASDGTIFEIEQRGHLYYLYQSSVNQQRKESLETWHKILGHCNIEVVIKLEHVVNGMHIRDQGTFDCEICTLANKSNQRNHEADTRATKPFKLVHTDLAGPIDPIAKGGFRYKNITFYFEFFVSLSPYLVRDIVAPSRWEKKHLEECRAEFPEEVSEIERSIYVDDLLLGGSSITELQKLKVNHRNIRQSKDHIAQIAFKQKRIREK
eukprot:gene13921-4873_t